MRLLTKQLAELSLIAAGFMMQKHERLASRKLSQWMIWLHKKRYGNNATEFLNEKDSMDENMEDETFSIENK